VGGGGGGGWGDYALGEEPKKSGAYEDKSGVGRGGVMQ